MDKRVMAVIVGIPDEDMVAEIEIEVTDRGRLPV
jgi:hypothetical protein